MDNKFLEIESKYDASEIDRIKFKQFARSLNPKSFLYVESTDIYYVKDNEFIRYRMPDANDPTRRSELTYKKKHTQGNNVVRTEVNLRVDPNDRDTVMKFCDVLGYTRNFSVYKMCDIYFYDDADIVLYSVLDEDGKVAHFLEIEVDESLGLSPDQAKDVLVRYEKLLAPLGINAYKRKKLSLFEMYVRR